MDSEIYTKYMAAKEEDFESLCKKCGECCGVSDDPCSRLMAADDGTHACNDYHERLGAQKTASGKTFTCVPIREHIAARSIRPMCAYKNLC